MRLRVSVLQWLFFFELRSVELFANGVNVKKAALLLILVSGCAPSRPAMDQMTPDVWRSPHEGSVERTNTVSATQGRLPLVYLVESPAMVRVMDATAGREVARAPAAQGQIVSVDANHGVHIAGQSLTGPLPAEHMYAIELDFAPPTATPARGGR